MILIPHLDGGRRRSRRGGGLVPATQESSYREGQRSHKRDPALQEDPRQHTFIKHDPNAHQASTTSAPRITRGRRWDSPLESAKNGQRLLGAHDVRPQIPNIDRVVHVDGHGDEAREPKYHGQRLQDEREDGVRDRRGGEEVEGGERERNQDQEGPNGAEERVGVCGEAAPVYIVPFADDWVASEC